MEQKNTKTLGIVGGLGTETSCSFCLSVNTKINQMHETQPHFIMDNVPVPKTVIKTIAHGNHSEEMRQLLKDSVQRLNTVGAKAIVIPCNTVHVFIDELRQISQVPIFSIIEETVRECQKKSFRTVGLLASTTTVKAKLYARELQEKGIKVILPTEEEQHALSESIVRINFVQQGVKDKENMHLQIKKLREQGAEAVILGCTDLFLLVSEKESVLPIINSTEVLENAAIDWLTSVKEN
ncbi:amino acid racemase [Candidatus Woesearchaeota archaeon]|nr:amino acid racemase [Candidatus Woesearchaeota archaeon]